MRKSSLALAAVAALFGTASASAATLIVNGSGELTGATGVSVLGSFYDVEFVDGTCPALFDGCDSGSDFAFHTFADALAASQALLDQVFVDGLYTFDTEYYLTFGCPGHGGNCVAITPFDLGVDDQQRAVFLASLADNNASQSGDVTGGGPGLLTFDSGSFSTFTFARFTPSAEAVPEPATWMMMLLGFGAVGMAARRRTRIASSGMRQA